MNKKTNKKLNYDEEERRVFYVALTRAEKRAHLTYAHTNHNQLPSDSSFTISQETFRSVLFHYVKIHHKNIPDEKRANWVEASVKAKNTFDVYY